MATFNVRWSCSVVPKEVTILSDGADTVTTINSNVDKTLGSSYERSYSIVAANISYDTYLTTTSYATIDSIITPAGAQGISEIYIRIISAAGAGTPDVQIRLGGVGGDESLKLSGVGAFCILPFSGLQSTGMEIKSTGATTVANIEILTAGT